jgi:hypothetical protein
MLKKWSKKFGKCQQCGTKRFKHKAKGLCTRCYRLLRKLEQVDRWDLSDPKSLKGYPRESCFHDPETLARVRAFEAREIRERLDYLKYAETILERPINGLDLEGMLNNIARQCGVKKQQLFFGTASSINFHFNPEQRRILYRYLNEIQENIPWKRKVPGPGDWYVEP